MIILIKGALTKPFHDKYPSPRISGSLALFKGCPKLPLQPFLVSIIPLCPLLPSLREHFIFLLDPRHLLMLCTLKMPKLVLRFGHLDRNASLPIL